MIYIEPEVRLAIKQLAAAEDRSASDLYREAVRAFLVGKGVGAGIAAAANRAPPAHAQPASAVTMLAEAIERQGARIEELHVAINELRGSAPRRGDGVPGANVGVAMRLILRILREAGDVGTPAQELARVAQAAGCRPGNVEAAKAALSAAGLIRYRDRYWFLE